MTGEYKMDETKENPRLLAEHEVLQIISRVNQETLPESCYRLLLSTIAKRHSEDAKLLFYFKPSFARKTIDYLYELSEEGFIHIGHYDDERGDFLQIGYITYKGRMELARLEREEKELRDRKWRWLIPLGSFILGSLLTAIMPRVANKLLDGWLSPEVHQVEVIKLPAEGVAEPGK